FALPPAPTPPAPVASTRPAIGLLALQDLPLSPEERRRKAVRRASAMLDGLAELQRGLLAGGMSPRTIERLRAGLAGDRDIDDDGTVAALLSAVETRCAVELAKLERPG
ncbi:MAG: flagellar assembly protein FliX, partial [Geminicoccaceae bacterium]